MTGTKYPTSRVRTATTSRLDRGGAQAAHISATESTPCLSRTAQGRERGLR
jgi:hypothetical protein